MSGDAEKKTCFIAMPIAMHADEAEKYGGDTAHWAHVMETLFVRAVEEAGFEPIRPVASGSDMIHGQIIKHLSTADMVLCDLSGHNPNVFFELGVRTSLNLPIALVAEESTRLPFDTAGINTHFYAPTLHGWEINDQVSALRAHITASVANNDGANPLWKHFGLTIAAARPDANESAPDAKLELIYDGMQDLRQRLDRMDQSNARLRVQSSDGRWFNTALRNTPDGKDVRDAQVASAAATVLGTPLGDRRRLDEPSMLEIRLPWKNEDLPEARLDYLGSIMRSLGFRLSSVTSTDSSLSIRAIDIGDVG